MKNIKKYKKNAYNIANSWTASSCFSKHYYWFRYCWKSNNFQPRRWAKNTFSYNDGEIIRHF